MIQLLDNNLINKIAAGEVVDRPASVVKELVENSIDAQASQISVYLEDGGIGLIKVIDNGNGMDKEDLKKSLTRHATSKIFTEQDLSRISTMGFRGEALASISAISELRIMTKTQNAKNGHKLEIRGESAKIGDYPTNKGTTVEVKNIFKNIPARHKFLKTPQTELKHCIDTLEYMVLSNPQISFALFVNNSLKFKLPANQKIIDRIKTLHGANLTNKLISVNGDHPHVKIRGFVGTPQTASAKPEQFLSVNKRPITDKLIYGAIKNAFSNLIMSQTNPTFFIYIETPADFVDVNAHPQKREVRFLNPNLVYSLTRDAVSKALEKHDLTYKGVDIKPRQKDKESIAVYDRSQIQKEYSKKTQPSFTKATQSDWKSFIDLSKTEKSLPQFMVIQNLYIIQETDEGVEILDQHAAHERVIYNKLKNNYLSNAKSIQNLLLPVKLQLKPSALESFGKYQKELENVGFIFKDEYITAVPTFIKADFNLYVQDVIADLDERGTFNQIDDKTERFIATMACKAAVKAGDRLDNTEIESMLTKLDQDSDKYTCPHGRPVKINLSLNDLNKMFKREI